MELAPKVTPERCRGDTDLAAASARPVGAIDLGKGTGRWKDGVPGLGAGSQAGVGDRRTGRAKEMDQSVDRGEAPRRRTSDGLAAVAIILLTLVLIVVVVSALV